MELMWKVVDILVVAYLIYRLIRLIRGTRTMQVLWGLFFLAIITAVAKLLELNTTVWLLEKFWVAGIVLVAIVFQPEIRAALAELGSSPLGRVIVSDDFSFIKELVAAVRHCSQHKVGFLVVLEQETGLRDIVRSGIRVDGEISSELLISIFFDGTPLHDGAVVVSGDRLVAAGCMLPLTEDQSLSKTFGMRHRAAVGITEISDAIVIVVSEETGNVSLVRGGRLQNSIATDELERRLYDLYRSKADKGLLRKAPRTTPQ